MSRISLPKIALFGLGVAGVLKLTVEFMPMMAIAETPGDTPPVPVELAAAPAPPSYDASAPGESGMCEPSHLIAEAIAEERALLKDQRATIADREAKLALAEQSLKGFAGDAVRQDVILGDRQLGVFLRQAEKFDGLIGVSGVVSHVWSPVFG